MNECSQHGNFLIKLNILAKAVIMLKNDNDFSSDDLSAILSARVSSHSSGQLHRLSFFGSPFIGPWVKKLLDRVISYPYLFI